MLIYGGMDCADFTTGSSNEIAAVDMIKPQIHRLMKTKICESVAQIRVLNRTSIGVMLSGVEAFEYILLPNPATSPRNRDRLKAADSQIRKIKSANLRPIPLLIIQVSVLDFPAADVQYNSRDQDKERNIHQRMRHLQMIQDDDGTPFLALGHQVHRRNKQ
jgi:hypothetical protein